MRLSSQELPLHRLIATVGLGALACTRDVAPPEPPEPPPPVPAAATVTVTPGSHTLFIDDTIRLAARVLDAGGATLAGPVRWQSSDTSRVRVDDGGLVRGVAPGSATVSAERDGVRGAASVLVVARPLPARGVPLQLFPDTNRLIVGVARTLTARALDTLNHERRRTGLRWTTSDPAVAAVDSAGTVTARGPGRATITAQAGDTTATAEVRVVAQPLVTFAELAVGEYGGFACGRTTEGEVYCWGSNRFGELGTDEVMDRCEDVRSVPRSTAVARSTYRCSLLPVRARLEGGAVDLAVTSFIACALRLGGDAWCWGLGGSAPFRGETGRSLPPRWVAPEHTFRTIEINNDIVCGIARDDDQAYCWGDNLNGKLGVGSAEERHYLSPQPVAGSATWQEVKPSFSSVCGLRRDGQTLCWGANIDGILAVAAPTVRHPGCAVACVPTPTPVRGAPPFVALAHTGNPSCGLDAAGDLYCWGHVATASEQPPARRVDDGAVPLVSLSGNGTEICGLTGAGALHCLVVEYRAGLGSFRLQPVLPGWRFRSIASGGSPRCGITVDGRAYCWGGALVAPSNGPTLIGGQR